MNYTRQGAASLASKVTPLNLLVLYLEKIHLFPSSLVIYLYLLHALRNLFFSLHLIRGLKSSIILQWRELFTLYIEAQEDLVPFFKPSRALFLCF